MSPDLAINTAVSFATTTTWQAYSVETTLRYLVHVVGLAAQGFLAGAAGLAVGIAFIRGFARENSTAPRRSPRTPPLNHYLPNIPPKMVQLLGCITDLACGHNLIGKLHAKEGRYAEAFAALDVALSLCLKSNATEAKTTQFPLQMVFSYAYRGWARIRSGQTKEGAEDLHKTIELWGKITSLDLFTNFEKARAIALLAKLGADSKSGVKAEEAKAYADQSLLVLRTYSGPNGDNSQR